MAKLRNHISIALGYFVLAAAVGLLLRSFAFLPVPFNYKFLLHTHSHIALLGWVYLTLTTLIYGLFVQRPGTDKAYRKIFWFTQITIAGMFLSFPFQGYALISILFSTLFLFSSYWYFWFFRRRVKVSLKSQPSYQCIHAALWFMVISSLGPLALGIIMNTMGAQSVWYRLAIYFYLHFLYNGFMVLALVGLVLNILEKLQFHMPPLPFASFFWGMNTGIALSFFLSVLFANPPLILNYIGGIGILLQIWAFGVLFRTVAVQKIKIGTVFSRFQIRILKTVILLLVVKVTLQLLTALPYFADLAASHLDFTIAYLHWTFLGTISIGLLLILDYSGLLYFSKPSYYFYLMGFAITETLIFYKGIAAWQRLSLFDGYFPALTIGSMIILIGLVFMLYSNMLKWKSVKACDP